MFQRLLPVPDHGVWGSSSESQSLCGAGVGGGGSVAGTVNFFRNELSVFSGEVRFREV